MNPQLLFVGGFVITAGMISYLDIHECSELPWPPRIVATGLVFGMLDLFSAFSPELAGIMAIGFALAFIVNNKLHPTCKTPKPCHCASQASDIVGIPPPALVPERTPSGEPPPDFRPAGEPPGIRLPAPPEIPELPEFVP